MNTILRAIPAMDDLLNTPWVSEYLSALSRETVKEIIADTLNKIRREISDGALSYDDLNKLIEHRACEQLFLKSKASLRPVVNATGVVLHTNLGRSPLAGEALAAAAVIGSSYSTLEYDALGGDRGKRNSHVEWSLCRLTGAEAALVVNNNAAAVLLSLSALATDKEVIVSSGELVEIGGSFRIPEILKFSGAKMKAVGCTNSTKIDDYSNAITDDTAVLLKVHPSNYRIEGFVKSTSREELAHLAEKHSLVFMEDLGSGLLENLNINFAEKEHSVRECIKGGSAIVTFSGDKLLGGPQIGVIAGSKTLIDKIKNHQLLRALRVDKMTLAAFEATLRLYLCGRHSEIPVIKMIEMDKNELLKKAQNLCRLLRKICCDRVPLTFSVVETQDAIGGGSFPTDMLAGYGVAISCADESQSCKDLAASLRAAAVPVISTINEDRVILHVRTLLNGDETLISEAMRILITAP
ncbi:MAG: L-seryl-tRNA(Sec) selenium transferase [Termitinemataceae bacterium]|nr:MAG: L-seryl-tRNA(Sec) selenium transferase [Termitinemataceae bacterium]